MVDLLGPHLAARLREYGIDPEDGIRLHPISARFVAAREERGWSIKYVAAVLGVPQYRLKAIESGPMREIHGDVLRRYAEHLGLSEFLVQWRARYPKLAKRLLDGEGGRSRRDERSLRDVPRDDRKSVVVLDVELRHVRPRVWRRIEVPADNTFYDLHVALQDAMGWADEHLHEFHVQARGRGAPLRIGLPSDGFPEDRDLRRGWRVPIQAHLRRPKDTVTYLYDFGDGWEHRVRVVAVKPHDGGRYPRCTAGAQACPPEDVGGPFGFAELLSAIRDPGHERHEEMLEWVGESYDPGAFDPAAVRFGDPKARLQGVMR
jgi:transcriptional regulator with XRE-family HTH domain